MSEDGLAKSSVVQDQVHFVFERHEKVNLMIEITVKGKVLKIYSIVALSKLEISVKWLMN